MSDIVKYYIPLNKGNLSTWLAQGVITPGFFHEGNWMDDVQKNCKCIFVFKKAKYVFESDCSIEVELFEDDKNFVSKDLDPKNDYVYYKGCIPQSRIKKIYFRNADDKKNVMSNMSSGNAFVDGQVVINKAKPRDVKPNCNCSKDGVEEIERKLKTFNQAMGSFCMLHLLTKYHPGNDALLIERIKYYCNGVKYNNEESVFRQKEEETLTQYYKKAGDLMKNGELKEWLNENGNPFKLKPSGIPDYNQIKQNEDLICAILGVYGDGAGRTKKFDDFLSDCTTGLFADKKDILPIVGALFGAREKYNPARSFYSVGGKRLDYKFNMSKPFDKFMLECIFQWSFNKEYKYAETLLKETKVMNEDGRQLSFLDEMLGEEKKKEEPVQNADLSEKEKVDSGSESPTSSTESLSQDNDTASSVSNVNKSVYAKLLTRYNQMRDAVTELQRQIKALEESLNEIDDLLTYAHQEDNKEEGGNKVSEAIQAGNIQQSTEKEATVKESKS